MKAWITGLLTACAFSLTWADDSTPDTEPDEPVAEQATDTATAPSPAPVVRPELPSQHSLHLQRLQRAYPDQFRVLDSGNEPAGALYLPANRTPARGWVILLPGYDQPADAAYNIDPLRQLLPQTGWHTLSLQLPAPDFVALKVSTAELPPPAASDESAEQTTAHEPDTDDEQSDAQPADAEPEPPIDVAEPVDDGPTDSLPEPYADLPDEGSQPEDAAADDAPVEYAQRVQALLDAAVTMAREQTGHLVLLGQQEGAYWLLHATASMDNPPDALILLHALQPEQGLPDAAPTLEALAGQCRLPVTDYVAPTWAGDAPAARKRLAASQRNPDNQYRLVTLKEPSNYLQQNEVLRRVKGRLILFDAK